MHERDLRAFGHRFEGDHFAEHPVDVPIPDWHRQVIAERLAAYRRGEMTRDPGLRRGASLRARA
jgi:hypothetical protein